MADEVADCIVVGAGFAGLSAATRLAGQGRSVLLLEARDRVGGRVKPGRIAGRDVDVGGMWLAPSQRRLSALADRFGVATFPTPLAGRNVVTLAGRRVHARGDDFLPALSLGAKLDLLQADLRLKWMQRSLAVERPWAHRRAGEWDRLSLGDWVRRTCRTRTAWTVFEAICRSLFCAEPDQVSLLFVLFYLRSGEGLDRLISAAVGGAQNLLADGGLHQIAAALAEALGERVRLGCPVTAIEQGDGEVVVRSGSTAFRARSVIVAVPPPLLADIAFTPALPEAKRQLLAGQVMGSCIKVWVAYERPFWREAGLNGFAALDAHPFNPFWDASPPGGGVGLIVGFFDAVHAVDWRERSPAARRAAVLAAIVEALGPAAADPSDYLEQDWNGEAWTRGCYGAYLAPGTLAAHGPALREPVGRVFWAGTETATEWSGYIEGAIQSGERAADAVLAGGCERSGNE